VTERVDAASRAGLAANAGVAPMPARSTTAAARTSHRCAAVRAAVILVGGRNVMPSWAIGSRAGAGMICGADFRVQGLVGERG